MAFAKVGSFGVGAGAVAADGGSSGALVPVDASLSRRREIEAAPADAPEAAFQVVAAPVDADARASALVNVGAAPTVAVQLVASRALARETAVVVHAVGVTPTRAGMWFFLGGRWGSVGEK